MMFPTFFRRFAVFSILLVAGILNAVSARGDDPLRVVQREFTQTIQPILQAACVDCHTGESADAGFNLDNYQTLEQLLNARKKWQKVELRIAAKEMPPEDAEPLAENDYTAVMKWLDQLLHSVDCTNINPGRVTLRRLNRTEYQNTIFDLIGIDYEPAADFPGDDVGYGFDNIADVLSLPPILMEKYLSAAVEISEQAIADPANVAFQLTRHGIEFESNESTLNLDDTILLLSNTTIKTKIKLPDAGEYHAALRACGDQVGTEPVKFSIAVNGKRITEGMVSVDADSFEDIEFEFNAKKGNNTIEIGFLNDEYRPATDQDPGIDRNLHVIQLTVSGPLGVFPAAHRKLIPQPVPTRPSLQRKLARKLIQRFANRGFRRPVTTTELERLTALYDSARDDGDGFEVALRLPIQAILVSPNFLYKVESPTPPGEIRSLNDFELATSVSYFLWSTMPDENLWRLAQDGKLKNEVAYRLQIEQMLADPRSSALVENFATQWLQLRHLESFQPDSDLFPGIDRELRGHMITETKMVLADLIQRDAKVTDLLDCETTFVNQRLAELYGIKGIEGEHFRQVSTQPMGRGGLLTHASILTLTSNPTRTSPVKRGKWIMENLLGEEPPPPDPAAMPLEDQAELTGSVRQRLEQHRADPNCAVCHKVMDELGFALENFDAVGRWREQDEDFVINATGILPDGSKFTGAREMQQTIKDQMLDQYVRCLTEKLLIYATGRGLEYFDQCAIDKIVEQLQKHDYRFSELIYQIAISDPFAKRSGGSD